MTGSRDYAPTPVSYTHLDVYKRQVYSAGQFALEANDVLSSLFSKHNEVILCGGTGLYIKALVEGLDEFPEVDPEIRNEMNSLYDSYGLIALQRQLAELDPVYYSTVDLNNPHRLIRALAVIKSKMCIRDRGNVVLHFFAPLLISGIDKFLTIASRPSEDVYKRQ